MNIYIIHILFIFIRILLHSYIIIFYLNMFLL